MPSVTFDSTEIVSTTYIPKFVKHESVATRELALLGLTAQDGAVLISEKYGVKRIFLSGHIKASSSANVETAIDVFTELFSRKEKNLDISWAGSTRRYVASCVSHNFDREASHISFVPWTAEFIVASGIGEDISETTLVSSHFHGPCYSASWTFAGSAEPKPRIKLKCDTTAADIKGWALVNNTTGERIVVTRYNGLDANKYFEIDWRLRTVTYDSIITSFRGVWPSWIVGMNSFTIYAGDILDQECDGPVGSGGYQLLIDDVSENVRTAQSFMVPVTDDTYQGLMIYGHKEGTPPDNAIFQIETDSNGKPSGTIIKDKSNNDVVFTIPAAAWGTSDAWAGLTYSGNSFQLTANTKYWIVGYPDPQNGSIGNTYYWAVGTGGTAANYKRGNRAYTNDGRVTWIDYPTQDLAFRLYYGGKSDATHVFEMGYEVYYYKRYL